MSHALELSPVERTGLYLRERFLSHRLHADQDAVIDAAARPGTASHQSGS